MSLGAFLRSRRMAPETLGAREYAHLVAAERAIAARTEEADAAHAKLKACKINVTSIAGDMGITRKTIYNNPVLEAYIEHCAKQSVRDGDRDEQARLREKVAELEEQVRKLVLRDVEAEVLRHENVELKRELMRCESRIREMDVRLEKARANAVKSTPQPKDGANVLPFPGVRR